MRTYAVACLAWGATVAALGLGCGGDSDSDSRSSVVEGRLLPSPSLAATPLDELDQQDSQVLCEDIVELALASFDPARLERSVCEVDATFSSPEPAACEDALDECLQDGGAFTEMALQELEEFRSAWGDIDCSSPTAFGPGCSATVAEYSACVNDGFDFLDYVDTGVSCSDAGDAEALDNYDPDAIPEPASCASLSDECGLDLGL